MGPIATEELILTDQDALEAALGRLIALDARLAPVRQMAGVPVLRRRPPGFAGLLHMVIAQQLSVAAARAISGRVDALIGQLVTPAAFLAAPPQQLRGAGLSAPKIRTLTAMATTLERGEVDLDAIHLAPSEEAAAALMRLPGVGRWTADLYLLFALGRADAFPSGDLALQVAAGDALDLGGRCTEAGLCAIAEDWRPLRGVAAHLLWAYYGARRRRMGAPA